MYYVSYVGGSLGIKLYMKHLRVVRADPGKMYLTCDIHRVHLQSTTRVTYIAGTLLAPFHVCST